MSVEITSIQKNRTPKSVLLSTSSYPKPSLAPGPAVSENTKLPPRLDQPKPQNDPYWVLHRQGNISKCNGCGEKINDSLIIGRVELDYFSKRHPDKSKQWLLNTTPRYYHLKLSCLKIRRPNLKVSQKELRFMDPDIIKGDIFDMLILE